MLPLIFIIVWQNRDVSRSKVRMERRKRDKKKYTSSTVEVRRVKVTRNRDFPTPGSLNAHPPASSPTTKAPSGSFIGRAGRKARNKKIKSERSVGIISNGREILPSSLTLSPILPRVQSSHCFSLSFLFFLSRFTFHRISLSVRDSPTFIFFLLALLLSCFFTVVPDGIIRWIFCIKKQKNFSRSVNYYDYLFQLLNRRSELKLIAEGERPLILNVPLSRVVSTKIMIYHSLVYAH